MSQTEGGPEPGSERLPPPYLIETIPEMEWLAHKLQKARRVAVDLESDSFYVYHEKVCLLQLSTEEEDYIVDPLAVKDLSPLGPLFKDRAVEKVFHAGEYDLLCLRRDYGFAVLGVFDTMVAARTLGESRLGLAALMESRYGIRLSKKLQRANWGQRPLSAEQIEYARLDTHHLLALRDRLEGELSARGLLEMARDQFHRLERVEHAQKPFDPEAYWNLPGARALEPRGKAVLRELYLFRERRAAELDRAPFRVMPEELLVRLAARPPENLEALKGLRGMTPYLLRAYGADVLEAVSRGLEAQPVEEPPQRSGRERMDGDSLRRYETLRAWRKQHADKLGLNPAVVLSTEEARDLAMAGQRGEPQEGWLEHLSPFKRQTYGKEILELLLKPRPAGIPGRRRRRRR